MDFQWIKTIVLNWKINNPKAKFDGPKEKFNGQDSEMGCQQTDVKPSKTKLIGYLPL